MCVSGLDRPLRVVSCVVVCAFSLRCEMSRPVLQPRRVCFVRPPSSSSVLELHSTRHGEETQRPAAAAAPQAHEGRREERGGYGGVQVTCHTVCACCCPAMLLPRGRCVHVPGPTCRRPVAVGLAGGWVGWLHARSPARSLTHSSRASGTAIGRAERQESARYAVTEWGRMCWRTAHCLICRVRLASRSQIRRRRSLTMAAAAAAPPDTTEGGPSDPQLYLQELSLQDCTCQPPTLLPHWRKWATKSHSGKKKPQPAPRGGHARSETRGHHGKA